MALLFADGFEDGTAAWAINATSLTASGRFGNGLACSTSTGFGRMGIAATSSLIAGFAFKPVTTAAVFIGGFDRTAGVIHIGVARTAAGAIYAYRTSTANVLGMSAVGVLPAGAWSYIELKATIHPTTGSVAVRVNGVEVINATGVNTSDGAPHTVSVVFIGSDNISGTVSGQAYDDVYICDTTGTVNNDFLGEIAVEHLRPASDDTAQWIGNDGNSTNNYDLVDEAGVPNEADYVSSAIVGQRDLYVPTVSSRSAAAPVVGIIVAATAMKTDVGTRTAKLCVKEGSGGTIRWSADFGLPTSFGEILKVFERKGDGSQFTVADVNALRFGMEVST